MNLGEPILDKQGYARVLGTMRDKTLLSEIRESAIACDLQRMRWLIEFGAFSVQPLIKAMPPQEAQNVWADRCEAALAVMSNARIEPPRIGNGPGLAVLDIPGEARQFFSGVCSMISKEMQRMGQVPDDGSRTWPMVSQAMGLAAMLDEPEVLVEMIDTHPNIAATPFPDACLGEDPKQAFFVCSLSGQKNVTNVMPMFCALAFSSTACVKALIPISADLPDLFSTSIPSKGTTHYDFQDALVSVQFPCKPEAMVPMMAHLLNKCQAKGNSCDPVFKAMRHAMEPTPGGGHGINVHLLPAMIDAGWVDLQPDRMHDTAVAYGHPIVVDHFEGRVDWDRLERQRSSGSSDAITALQSGRTAGLLAMIQQAKRAGREEAALAQFMRGSFLDATAADVLLNSTKGAAFLPHLLSIGLKPSMQVVNGTSLHDRARQKSIQAPQNKNPALDILNSFVARSKAHALIDEMEEPKAGHAPV